MKKTQGFTLIELLVVISIVGLLSSVILASLKTAREKAADASVKQQLTAMRNAAAFLYDSSGTYDDVCLGTTNSGKLYEAAYARGSKVDDQSICVSSSNVAGRCRFDIDSNGCATANPGKWAATVQLKSKANTWFCVDWQGNAKENTARVLDTSGDPDGPSGPLPGNVTIVNC